MKKFVILIFVFALQFTKGHTQVQATVKAGSQPNSVYIAFKSSVTLTASKFSTFQFAIGIPTSVSTGITASVTTLDPLMAYAPLFSTESQGGVSYRVFSFSGDGGQSGTGTTYTAGVEYNYAEVFLSGATITLNDVRIMQVPNGGSTTQVNFYIADKGTDVTNQPAQFYATVPTNFSNDGSGYVGSSFAKIGAVVLPVKFLGFTAIKKNNDAVLTWQIENESSLTAYYEVERSVNGVDFKKVNTVAPKNNGSSSNSYNLTDINLAALQNAGIFYYRIKQFDKDGKFIYSEIRSVRLTANGLIVGVYPNPIKDFANVAIDMEQDAEATLTVNDALGKQVQTMQVQLFKGPNIKKINMASYASGSYLLMLKTKAETKTVALVKAN